MFPKLHEEVSALLEEDDLDFKFHNVDQQQCQKDYDTNIMGRFICANSSCDSKGWSSKVVPITIRMYPGDRYNARVYHQRCKACNWIAKPIPDGSYAERVAYRLKKWSGVQIEPPDYVQKKMGKPHKSHLCEGCKANHCTWNSFLN